MSMPPSRNEDLTHLNIVGLKPKRTVNGVSIETQVQAEAYIEKTEFTRDQRKPYERLAADKPGEEMVPDAGIWQLYVEEASEHDTELVKAKNGNLDVMLLFAALFSAIVTAFLVESKKLLQEDTDDLAITLLLAIAQSQQRMEQGAPQIQPLQERPSFSASVYAKWINGLWFTALSLSLAAALIAMLAKEWLAAYTASRSRSPHIYTRLRQARLDGMNKWKALLIIDLLPLALHLSVLLFSAGLALYLWKLDSGTALVQITIMATAFVFYFGTTAMGVIYRYCPFVTHISKYLYPLRIEESEDATDDSMNENARCGDLQALLWLVKNASDPTVSDCACQALAGLQLPTEQAPLPNGDDGFTKGSESDPGSNRPNNLEDALEPIPKSELSISPLASPSHCYIPIRELFDQTCARLHKANVYQRRDLEGCQGINVARYSIALPVLVQCLESYKKCILAHKGKLDSEAKKGSRSPAQRALDALDAVLCNNSPAFNCDAYVLLASAEVRLVNTLTNIYYPKYCVPSKRCSQSRIIAPQPSIEEDPNEWTEIELESDEAILQGDVVSLNELQARFSRALARSSVLLRLHVEGQITINQHPLTYLLDSIYEASQNVNLNPSSIISTSLPQQGDKATLPMFIVALVGTGTVRTVPPNDLGDSDNILPVLVRIISDCRIERLPRVEISGVRALAFFGPVLIRQWMNIMTNADISNRNALERLLIIWPKLPNPINLSGLVNLTLAQLLCVSAVALSQIDSRSISGLAETAVDALYSRANMESGQSTTCFLGDYHPEVLEQFIQMASWASPMLTVTARSKCMRLFLIEKFDKTLIGRQTMSPSCLTNLLGLITQTPGYGLEVKKILSEVKTLVAKDQNSTGNYLSSFTRMKEGFQFLVEIAAIPEYTLLAMEFILHIVQITAEQSDENPWSQHAHLSRDAIEGFLTAVKLALQNKEPGLSSPERLASFMRGVIVMLDRINDQDLVFSATRQSLASINSELASTWGSSVELGELREEWENLEVQNYAPGDAWYLRGVSKLFELP